MIKYMIVSAIAVGLSAGVSAEPLICDFSLPGSRDASWSPDGTKLVFGSNRDGNQELYVVNADGSGLKRLTQTEADEYYPFYSPDGSQLVFMSYSDNTPQITKMRADGSNIRHLTPAGEENADPDWSPDGSQIIFYSERDGNAEIYVMDTDGNNAVRLTNTDSDEQTPSFSPDGKQVIFISTRDGNAQIYKMNADGTEPQRVSQSEFVDRVARWSPTGSEIVFYARPATGSDADTDERNLSWAQAELYSISPDGDNRTQITHNNFLDQSPVVSPNGEKIAFTSCESGGREVHVIDADGSNARRLTFSRSAE